MADDLTKKKPDLGSGSSSVSAPKQAPAPKTNPAPAPKAQGVSPVSKQQSKPKPNAPKTSNPFKGNTMPGFEGMDKLWDNMNNSAQKVIDNNKKPAAPKVDPVRQKILQQGFGPTPEQLFKSHSDLDNKLRTKYGTVKSQNFDPYKGADEDSQKNVFNFHTNGKGSRRNNRFVQNPDGTYKYTYNKDTDYGEEVTEDNLDDAAVEARFDELYKGMENPDGSEKELDTKGMKLDLMDTYMDSFKPEQVPTHNDNKNPEPGEPGYSWKNDVLKRPQLLDVDIVSMMEQDPDKYDYEAALDNKDYKDFEIKFNNLRNDLYNQLISGKGDYTFTPEEANQALDSYLGTLDEHKQAMGYKESPQQQNFKSPSEQKIENEDKFQKERATDYLKEKYSNLNSITSDKELDDAFNIVQNYGLNKQDLENAGLNILANQLFDYEDEEDDYEKRQKEGRLNFKYSTRDWNGEELTPEERKIVQEIDKFARKNGDSYKGLKEYLESKYPGITNDDIANMVSMRENGDWENSNNESSERAKASELFGMDLNSKQQFKNAVEQYNSIMKKMNELERNNWSDIIPQYDEQGREISEKTKFKNPEIQKQYDELDSQLEDLMKKYIAAEE